MAYNNQRQLQGEITQNLDPDVTDARQRLNASRSSDVQAYPMGASENVNIKEHGLLFSFRRPMNAAPQSRGARKPLAFETLNGLQWGQYAGGEREMEARMIFMGVSKSSKQPLDPTDPAIGMAAVTFGGYSCNIRSNTQAINPGDEVCFQVPAFHTRPNEIQQAHHRSYAKDAIVPIINPLDWSRVNFYLEDIYNIMFSTDTYSGVYNVGDAALDRGSGHGGKGLNPDQRAALAMRKTTIMTATRTIEELALRGLIKIMTPSEKERQEIAMEAINANPRLLARYKNVRDTNIIQGVNTDYQADPPVANMPLTTAPTLVEKHMHFKMGLHLQKQAQFEGTTVASLRTRHQHEVLFLASILGAVPSKMRARVVQNSVLQAVYGQYSAQMHGSRIFSTTVAELAAAYPSNPLIVSYVRNSEDFVSEFHQLVDEGYHNLKRTCIGIALSYVPVGAKNAKLDLAVNLRA